MNRKLSWIALGLLGILGLGNVARCVDREETSEGCSLEEKVVEPVVQEGVINIQADVERLNQINSNYRLTSQEMVFLTRIIYFEDGSFVTNLREGFSENEIRKSNEAIASVLLNRYEFDTQNNSNKFHRKVSNGSLITYARFNNAFSCLKDKKKYFNSESFRDENGNLTLMHSGLDQEYLKIAYTALVRVLSDEVEDPTNGALYYKTIQLGRTREVVWHNTEAFWLNGNSCKMDWNVNITNHQYYGVNCEV